jgi:hypothetical protein
LRSTSLVLSVVLCGGCGVEGGYQSDSGKERAPVLNGSASGPEEDGVVQLLSANSVRTRYLCTGTLVAKNLVATARHCVSNFDNGSFDCTPEGKLDPGSDGGEMGTLLVPADVEIRTGVHVDFSQPPQALGSRIFAALTTTLCNNDIAFVVLDRDIEGVSPYSIRLTSSVEPGDTLRAVGYGLTEAMETAEFRYARDGLRVALVGDNEFRPDGELLAPRAFLTEGPALCLGDSGGPAFAESGALVGVFSLVAGGDCDSPRVRNVFTQVSPFHATVIGPAFEAAGATPIAEPSAGGSGGTASTDGGAAGEGASDGGAGSSGRSGAGPGGASSGGSAGSAAGNSGTAGEAPIRRGLRQEGGCRCGIPGRANDISSHLGLVVLGMVAVTSRVRRSRRRAA